MNIITTLFFAAHFQLHFLVCGSFILCEFENDTPQFSRLEPRFQGVIAFAKAIENGEEPSRM